MPKTKLWIKLKPGVSESERKYLANGIRAYLSDLSFLVDVP